MKIVFATSAQDPLGGVFAKAYREAGGPAPAAIFVHADRKELGFPWWASGVVALKLTGLTGTLRLAAVKLFRRPLTVSDEQAGLAHPYLEGICGPETVRFDCRSLNEPARIEALQALRPDVLVSVGAPVIFKKEVLRIPHIGCINVHNGKIPAYRGHFGTFWEIHRGEDWCYTSVHEMVPVVDTGPLLAYGRVPATSGGFLDVLIQKKRQSGQLLAQVLSAAAAGGSLPGPVSLPPGADSTPGYYPWPTVSDVLRFRHRKAAPASHPHQPRTNQ